MVPASSAAQGANYQDKTKTRLEQRGACSPNNRHQLVKFWELAATAREFFSRRRVFGFDISGRKAASSPIAGRNAQT